MQCRLQLDLGRRCAQLLHRDAAQAGLGIEQELSGGDHLLALLQPFENLRVACGLLAQAHFQRTVTPFALGEHHQGAATAANHRLARHQQHIALGRASQTHLGGQPRTQATVGIVQRDPYAQGAAVQVGLRQNGLDAPAQHFAGKGRQPRLDHLAGMQAQGFGFRHRHLQPYAAQAVDSGQGLAGHQVHALAHIELLQHPGNGAGHRPQRLYFAAALEAGDQCRRHAGQAQTLARRRQQRRIAGITQGQVVFLGADPGRHQQVGQGRAGLEQILGGAGVDPFDEAASTRLHHGDIAAVEGQVTDRFQAVIQCPAGHRCQAHAEVLGDARIDADGGAAATLFGIARHQLHIHKGRLARLVELLLRHHRVVPIEHLALACGTGLCRSDGRVVSATHGLLGEPVAAGRAHSQHQRGQQRIFY